MNYVAVLFLLAYSLPAAAQNQFFPLRRGANWEVIKSTGKGKHDGKIVYTVDHYDSSSIGIRGNIKAIPFDKSNKQKAKTDVHFTLRDDSLFIDMTYYYRMYDNLSYKWRTEQGSFVIPPTLQVGETLPEGKITFTVIKAPKLAVQVGPAPKDQLGKQATYTLSERKVEAIESVTVPAGTFECFRIASKGEFHSEVDGGSTERYTMIEWLSKSAGFVKSETYKNGKLSHSLQLSKRK